MRRSHSKQRLRLENYSPPLGVVASRASTDGAGQQRWIGSHRLFSGIVVREALRTRSTPSTRAILVYRPRTVVSSPNWALVSAPRPTVQIFAGSVSPHRPQPPSSPPDPASWWSSCPTLRFSNSDETVDPNYTELAGGVDADAKTCLYASSVSHKNKGGAHTASPTLGLVSQGSLSSPDRNAFRTATIRAVPHAVDHVGMLPICKLLFFRFPLALPRLLCNRLGIRRWGNHWRGGRRLGFEQRRGQHGGGFHRGRRRRCRHARAGTKDFTRIVGCFDQPFWFLLLAQRRYLGDRLLGGQLHWHDSRSVLRRHHVGNRQGGCCCGRTPRRGCIRSSGQGKRRSIQLGEAERRGSVGSVGFAVWKRNTTTTPRVPFPSLGELLFSLFFVPLDLTIAEVVESGRKGLDLVHRSRGRGNAG